MRLQRVRESAQACRNDAQKHLVSGDVGDVFKKRFDTGWVSGEIKEIRLGAEDGKDRRVLYTDGDIEDLSVQDLVNLSTSTMCSGLG